MALFSDTAICMDMGSVSTRVISGNRGELFTEATAVLTLRDDASKVLSVGNDAFRMYGKSGDDVIIRYPVQDGAVTDSEMCALYMVAMAEKAGRHRRTLDKAQLYFSVPQGLTKVERSALEQAARLMGTRRPAFVLSPLAAAIGAGLLTTESKGTMAVTLGGSLTEIAVISMNAIVAARSIRSGSLSMDDAIVRYMRRAKGLIIGERTAERLKVDIGTARLDGDRETNDALPDSAAEPQDSDTTVTVKGRDASTRDAKSVSVTKNDIAVALRENIRMLVDALRDALARTPVALAGDISERGILLSGGGANLDGLCELLSDMTGVPVHKSAHPEDDVGLGLKLLADDPRLLASAIENGSAEM
ncbi:MAG: rod shape-determining protein [Christensenellales bacterium]|jgi:rod shape-determining protein MreB